MRNEKTLVGSVFVDAGLLWFGDPCYVMGDDASSRVTDWSVFCERIHTDETEIAPHVWEPLSPGIGLAITSGYGDGEYPVYVTYNHEGRVKSVTVAFNEDGDEDDEDGWGY